MNAWVHGREICITKTFMVPKKINFYVVKIIVIFVQNKI